MEFKFIQDFFLPLLSLRSHWSCFGNKGPFSFQAPVEMALLCFYILWKYRPEIRADVGRMLTVFIVQDSCLADLMSGRPHIGNWWTPSKSYLTTLTGRSSQAFGREGESQSNGRMPAILIRGLSVWSLRVSAWIWRGESTLQEAQ